MEEERSSSPSLFSMPPVSFKMNVNSPQATGIRTDVSRKLGEFLGDYIDDVLTACYGLRVMGFHRIASCWNPNIDNYIVVLVCNGKHQNQARDDLHAFLGDNSDEFITWLWHHLSKRLSPISLDSMTPVVKGSHSCVNFSDTDRKGYKNGRAPSLQKDSDYGASTISSNPISVSTIDPLVDLQCQNPDLQVPFEIGAEKHHPLPKIPNTLQCISESAFDYQNEAQNIKCPSQILVVNNQNEVGVQFENHQNKMTKDIHAKELHHLSNKCLPESRIVRSVITEDPYPNSPSAVDIKSSLRNPSSKYVDVLLCNDNHSRGSVWDRLGKPCEDNEKFVTAEEKLQDEEKKVDPVEKKLVRHRMVKRLSGRMPITSVVGENAHNDVTNPVDTCNTPKRKYEFNDPGYGYNSASSSGHTEDHFHSKHKSQKLLEKSSLNQSVQPLPEKRTEPHASDLKINKNDHLNYTAEKTSHVPKKNEILDVKLKLQQVEKEMLKLRSNLAEFNNDAKTLPMPPSNKGVHNAFEDVESRTVVVKNVHFAATKEDLSLHFTKCGSVANVILITDTAGQPKGSAYIVFATKDSVEKAVSLSGTSFFSRLLKVIRKADDLLPGTSLETIPSSCKKQPLQSRTKPLQRNQYPVSLQWRREVQKKAE